MKAQWIVAGVLVPILVAGCPGEPTADDEACEHLQQGPAVAVTATTAAANAPAIDSDHQRYDVTLVDVTGGKGGIVKYASAEAADFIFFFGADVPVRFLDATGAEVAPEESATSSAACAEIEGRHVVPLGVGTYSLSFGPTTQTSVGIVVEEAAGPEGH